MSCISFNFTPDIKPKPGCEPKNHDLYVIIILLLLLLNSLIVFFSLQLFWALISGMKGAEAHSEIRLGRCKYLVFGRGGGGAKLIWNTRIFPPPPGD